MNKIIRAGLVIFVLAAGPSGCSGIRTTIADTAPSSAPYPTQSPSPATASVPASVPASASLPSPPGLDAYKTQVARHVVEHNRERLYQGILPPLLPAVVVLRITVDREGQLEDVAVQRSRNQGASQVAVASMWRSAPLPRPQQLAQARGQLTFLETFLFADGERYQLRSLAGPQASE